MTEHVVASRWLGCEHVLALTAAQYREARRAKDLLLAGLALEESYDVVVLNYESFETAIFAATISTVLDRRHARHEIEELRRNLDRHLVNLLASGEMYLAHARAILTSATRRGHPVDGTKVAARRRSLEVELPGFAAMKWLRNATLHQTLPISSWSFGGSWSDGAKGPAAKRRHSLLIALDRELLPRIRDLPADLLVALASRADDKGRIAWRDLAREYVEGISRLNAALREALEVGEQAAHNLLEEMVRAYREPFGGDRPLSVEAVQRDAAGRWLESFPLDFDYTSQIAPLRRKNATLVNLRKMEILD